MIGGLCALAVLLVLLVAVSPMARTVSFAGAAAAHDWRRALDITKEQADAEREQYASACDVLSACGAIAPNKFNIIVIGDSHGADGFNIARAIYPDAHIIKAARGACFPLIDNLPRPPRLGASQAAPTCQDLNAALYGDRMRLEQADLIFFSVLTRPVSVRLLEDTLTALQGVDTPIVVLGNGPVFSQPLPEIVSENNLSPRDLVPDAFMNARFPASLDDEMRTVVERHGAHFVPMRDFFCPEQRCTAWTSDGTRLLTYDNHHLTLAAAETFARARGDMIKSAVIP